MGLSPILSFHGCVQASSFVFLRAVRAWAAPSSKALISFAVDSNGTDGILVFPKSSSGVVRLLGRSRPVARRAAPVCRAALIWHEVRNPSCPSERVRGLCAFCSFLHQIRPVRVR